MSAQEFGENALLPDVSIPHTSAALDTIGLSNVPFDNDSTGSCRRFSDSSTTLQKHPLGPIVMKSMSEISVIPFDPDSPTLITGLGFDMSWKALPLPAMTDHASPTI